MKTSIHCHDVLGAMNLGAIQLIDNEDLTKTLYDSPNRGCMLMLNDVNDEVLLKKGGM